MDVFQRQEAARRLLAQKAPGVWVEFRTAILSLTNSYNETSVGNAFPVVTKVAEGCTVILERQEGSAQDRFHALTLVIGISFETDKYVITATQERWLSRYGSHIGMSHKPLIEELQLEVGENEPPGVLIRYQDRLHSASDAAELFLGKALALMGWEGSRNADR